MLGVPPKLIRSIADMAEIRKQKAEDLARAKAAERAMALADGASKAGKAVKDMSEAKMGEDSALDRTLNIAAEMNR